ncbi:hypothetical protein [Streptomyces sp. NPDC059378]|uniref:hypothetical protein n=1 Tax=Streptomyces sp. NPDC059378 TaxID=3346815 RepID=UPI0036C1E3D3
MIRETVPSGFRDQVICLATLCGWLVAGFAEVIQEAGDAVGDALVAFDLTVPVGVQVCFLDPVVTGPLNGRMACR